MLAILNFHLNKGNFFFVGVWVIEVDPLVYSLSTHMIFNQFSEAGKQDPLCWGNRAVEKSLLILLPTIPAKCVYPDETH